MPIFQKKQISSRRSTDNGNRIIQRRRYIKSRRNNWKKEPVNSPTFTIVQEYEDGKMPFYHFDVYRISDVEEMYEIGYEDYFFGQGICLIEWAELIEDILPENVIHITITKDLDKGFDYRRIEITDEGFGIR